MNSLKRLSLDIAHAPRVGDPIVWRFKGALRWNSGTVKAVMAGYQIVEIERGGSWPEDRVALSDIDWHRK